MTDDKRSERKLSPLQEWASDNFEVLGIPLYQNPSSAMLGRIEGAKWLRDKLAAWVEGNCNSWSDDHIAAHNLLAFARQLCGEG